MHEMTVHTVESTVTPIVEDRPHRRARQLATPHDHIRKSHSLACRGALSSMVDKKVASFSKYDRQVSSEMLAFCSMARRSTEVEVNEDCTIISIR